MPKSNVAIVFAVVLVIVLMPTGMGLELQVTGALNTTFYVNDSYNVQDNNIYVEKAGLAEPTIIFNGNAEGVNPLSPPKLVNGFVLGDNYLNFTEAINYFQLNVTYTIKDGYRCLQNPDCDSGACNADYAGGVMYCAQSSFKCVHNTGSLPVAQYDNGDTDSGYKCSSGTWKADDGYSCIADSDCDSGYCRGDHTGGNKYCAASSSGCVHYVSGSKAKQYSNGQNNGNYVCSSGMWSVLNGYTCIADSNCTSGFCRTDFTSPTDMYCAKDSKSCVHKYASLPAVQFNTNKTESNSTRKCLDGFWSLPDADGDNVADSTDKCPNTPPGCVMGLGGDDINATTGCPNKPVKRYDIKDNPSSICLGSSLPVDPVESGCLGLDKDGKNLADNINVSFFLRNATGLYAANNPPECNLMIGTFGWHDVTYYCEFSVADGLKPGTYDLVAKYSIPSGPVFADTFRSGFDVNSLCSLDTKCKHGGHIKNQVSLSGGDLSFNMPSDTEEGTGAYITCMGAKGTISNVAQYIAQCSDGASSTTVNPGLLVWVYDSLNPGNYLEGGYSDNRFQGGTFNMTPKPRRTDVLSSTSGYRWTSNLGWSSGASSNRVNNFYTFNAGGEYLAYLVYINNFCDSPDYICPNNPHPLKGSLCDFGSLKTTGFVDLKNYSIKVVSPDLDMTGNSPGTFYVSSPYNPTIKKIYTWSMKNNGTGKVSITGIDVNCPPNLECTSLSITDADIDEAGELNINTEFSLPCEYSVTSYPVNLTFDVDDGYGLTCSAPYSQIVTADIIQGNLSDDSAASCQCYTGKNDLWGGKRGCCDAGDCWVSEDKKWICNNGEKVGLGVEFCESLYACGKDNYWDGSEWSDKIPTECKCFDSFDCETGQCIDGICMIPTDPNVTFDSSSFTIELGAKDQTIIYLKNNLGAEDTLKVKLSVSPEKMNQWLKFANEQNEIDVRLGAHEEALIPLEVFGGEIGVYSVVVYATSSVVEDLDSRYEQKIAIVDSSSQEYARTPEINWASFIIVAFIAAFFVVPEAGVFR